LSDTAERHSAHANPRVPSAAERAYAYALRSRPLTSSALVVYAVSLALLLGLWSAYRAVSGTYPFGQMQAGSWRTTPRVGSREADPYARAVVARRAEIPLAIGEGLTLTATADSAGRTLDPGCAYRIGPTTPQARYWTVTLYDDDGRPVPSELQRSGFTSTEVLRDTDGGFAIVVSRDPVPGNWLRMPEGGRIGVAFRLYDTPVAAGTAALDGRTLPTIERLDCAS
jgi:hypothetical protein